MTIAPDKPHITLNVDGLCCQTEKSLLDRKMSSIDGVVSHDVNVVAQRLSVDYDPARVSQQDLIKAVAETGMKATVAGRDTRGARLRWWREARIVLLGVCGVLTATAFSVRAIGAPDAVVIALFTAAIVTGGYYPARSGLSAARSRSMNLNTLLILAAVGAAGLDLWDEAAVLVFVYSLGNVLETYVVSKSRGALRSLSELAPKEAMVVRDGERVVVPAGAIAAGDTVVVRPGERIPVDGIVRAGETHVDEAAITGEPVAVAKREGARVFAGTINQRGAIEVFVEKTPEDSTLARIIQSVEEAQSRKSKYQQFGERFSAIYTPLMFASGIAIAVVPPLVFGGSWSEWFYRALVMFVVSCSCGLALSVPVAIVAAVGNGARRGILFKGGLYLERVTGVRVVAFDKTGTLTIGRPRVSDETAVNGYAPAEMMAIAAAVESRSEHPIAQAIVRKARESDAGFAGGALEAEGVTADPGGGIRGVVGGKEYVIGSCDYVRAAGCALTDVQDRLAALDRDAKTTVVVAEKIGLALRPIGLIGVTDTVRPQARGAVAALRNRGLDVVMLTGDHDRAAAAIAEGAGITEYNAGLLPHTKATAVDALRSEKGPVMMVGDGINDAPAMAAADVGVAMGAAGTDVAIETSDIALMADDLSKLPELVDLGRRTMTNVRQNVFASLATIAALVPLAVFGQIDLLTGLLLNEGAALLVILNGLRLLR